MNKQKTQLSAEKINICLYFRSLTKDRYNESSEQFALQTVCDIVRCSSGNEKAN